MHTIMGSLSFLILSAKLYNFPRVEDQLFIYQESARETDYNKATR